MVWIADVTRDRSMPLDQVHVALFSYFPQLSKTDDRPYVWRLLTPETALVVSRLRSTANKSREVMAEQGVTYDFHLTFKRVRNVGGNRTLPDGTKKARTRKVVEMTDQDELKERLVRFAGARGGDVRYVRIEGMRFYEPARGVKLPICDAVGKVFVRDPEAFDALLAGGGPGTGKAYGLGLWYLPEIMEARRAAA